MARGHLHVFEFPHFFWAPFFLLLCSVVSAEMHSSQILMEFRWNISFFFGQPIFENWQTFHFLRDPFDRRHVAFGAMSFCQQLGGLRWCGVVFTLRFKMKLLLLWLPSSLISIGFIIIFLVCVSMIPKTMWPGVSCSNNERDVQSL